MTKRVEGAGLNVEQGLSTKSPDAMRHTSPGMANYNVYTGIDGSAPAGGAGAASASTEILQGESFAEQTPMPGKQG